MTKLFQINITANWGSHGKIAENLGNIAVSNGWESYIAFGRWFTASKSQLYRIGSNCDEYVHGVISRLFDNHGLMSANATRRLIKYIETVSPDIIHLHNIHGYYLNYPILFEYLSSLDIPIVWTLHDCWAFTGHCAHYMFADCCKWQTHCKQCPLKENYPKTIFLDRSYRNFELKKKHFLSLKNLTLVPVSKWLETDIKQSFLGKEKIRQIHNGIDTNLFNACNDSLSVFDKYKISSDKKIILGVASNWWRKGLPDFVKLRSMLDKGYSIIVVGLKEKELKELPSGIVGIRRTENVNELIQLYSVANVYFNPTWEDNFPTTNLEAMACGTPVVTYDTGGSKECLTANTGYAIPKGQIEEARDKIIEICSNGKDYYAKSCRQHIVDNFNKEQRFSEYWNLYNELLQVQTPKLLNPLRKK